jgi:hypothetical protein
MLNLEADKQEQAQRREDALKQMRETVERLAGNLKENLSVNGLSRAAQETIQRHPWMATGAALGAGFLATQLLRPGPAKVEPQRVVVELKQPNGTVVTAQPAAASGGIIRDAITAAATAAFVAARPLLEKVVKEFIVPAEPVPSPAPAKAKRNGEAV